MLQKTVFEMPNSQKLGGTSDYFSFAFGCAKEPVDGNIDLVHGTHTCREGLFSNMRTRICGSNDSQPMDKTRMMFVWRLAHNSYKRDNDIVDGWIDRAVPIVQVIDKLAGWPLTRAYKVDAQDGIRAYYFHSSRRWMKSSYLISLYVLLVRMAKDMRVTGFKDFDGLYKILADVTSGGKSGQDQKLASDNSYVKDSLPYWEALMKGYPRLFRKRKMPYYWDTSRLNGGSGGSEGIQYLVKGSTQYGEVREELLKIKKELDAKKSK
jgi:hypothetical protein